MMALSSAPRLIPVRTAQCHVAHLDRSWRRSSLELVPATKLALACLKNIGNINTTISARPAARVANARPPCPRHSDITPRNAEVLGEPGEWTEEADQPRGIRTVPAVKRTGVQR